MERKSILSKSFFSVKRDKTITKENDDYSKIKEIKWKKDILTGKNKVIASLPKDKKMI